MQRNRNEKDLLLKREQHLYREIGRQHIKAKKNTTKHLFINNRLK